MHLQPVFRHCRVCGGTVSAPLLDTGLCRPSGPAMSDAEQRHVIAPIADVPRCRKPALKTETTRALTAATMTERMIRV